MNTQEGFISAPGGKLWYEIVGEKGGIPLLIVHGGPGFPHDYLTPLASLSDNRQVIFYDQLGAGNSEPATDPLLWTLERFVSELEAVITNLNLSKYHLLGHSWGAGVAVSFASQKPTGLVSLILSNPYLSSRQWEQDAQKHLQELPTEMQQAIRSGTIESDEYKSAIKEFYHQFMWRIDPFPTELLKSDHKINLDIYTVMWGPDDFHATGTLKDYDVTATVSTLTVPTLFLCGRYDVATPTTTEKYKNLLPHTEFVVFEESAHIPHITEKEKYHKVVEEFLQKSEEGK